jgi:hypothetical protein
MAWLPTGGSTNNSCPGYVPADQDVAAGTEVEALAGVDVVLELPAPTAVVVVAPGPVDVTVDVVDGGTLGRVVVGRRVVTAGRAVVGGEVIGAICTGTVFGDVGCTYSYNTHTDKKATISTAVERRIRRPNGRVR